MSSVNQVRASHILIKHQGSRRKASWKDPGGRVIMSTTCDSADFQLKALREDVVSGKAKFEDLAASLPLQLREVWRRSTVNQGSGQIMKEYQQYPGGGKKKIILELLFHM